LGVGGVVVFWFESPLTTARPTAHPYKATSKLRETPLPVLVQVNTSGEASKSGVPPDECLGLVRFILDQCPHLVFRGLMTIGENARELVPGEPNPDFVALGNCRARLCETLGLPPAAVELSMGMSGDFEHAVRRLALA
jgi:uncharacterized pyridoxal phosphate-containing UPF0001 family protein